MKSRVIPPNRSLAIWLVALHTALVIAVWGLRDTPFMTRHSPLMVLPLILGAADSPVMAVLSRFRSVSLSNDSMAMLLGLGGLYWGVIGYGVSRLLETFTKSLDGNLQIKSISPTAQTGGPVRRD